MASLPEPRHLDGYRICMLCLGNICRSPTAEVVLTELLDRAGLGGQVQVESAGLGTWHVGEAIDQRAGAALIAAGYDPSGQRAAHVPTDWATRYDVVLAMEIAHVEELRASTSSDDARGRVVLFGDFDPVRPGGEVPDPFYGGPEGFQEVLSMIERTSVAIVAELERLFPPPEHRQRDRG